MTLKELRKNSGLKVIYIAKKLNITRQQYRNYEKGVHKPKDNKIFILSKLFNVTEDEIKESIIIEGE